MPSSDKCRPDLPEAGWLDCNRKFTVVEVQ